MLAFVLPAVASVPEPDNYVIDEGEISNQDYTVKGSFTNNGTVNGYIVMSDYYNDGEYGVEWSHSVAENNGVINGPIDNDGIFTNNGEIHTQFVMNDYNFTNNGTINIDSKLPLPDSLVQDDITLPSFMFNYGGFLNGATYSDDGENYELTATGSGTINGDVMNLSSGWYINNGTINGDFCNKEQLYNGIVGSIFYSEDEYTANLKSHTDGTINANVLYNGDSFFPSIYNGGTIKVASAVKGKKILLSISDSGIGIAPENQTKIFERFVRIDSEDLVNEANGSGLGLSIAKWIANSHAIKISVDSELGAGTTFTLEIPIHHEN